MFKRTNPVEKQYLADYLIEETNPKKMRKELENKAVCTYVLEVRTHSMRDLHSNQQLLQKYFHAAAVVVRYEETNKDERFFEISVFCRHSFHFNGIPISR
jgi:hypothetical protein